MRTRVGRDTPLSRTFSPLTVGVVVCLTAFTVSILTFAGRIELTLAAIAALLVAIAALTILGNEARTAKLAYWIVSLTLFDISPFALGGSTLRLYQPLSAVLILAVIMSPSKYLTRLGRQIPILAGFTVVVALSAIWTISPYDTLVVAIGQFYLLLLATVVCILLSRGTISVSGTLKALLIGAAVSSFVAVLQFAGGLAGSRWGIQYVSGIPWGRPSGLASEPDWAALTAAIGLILAAAIPDLHKAVRRWAIGLFLIIISVTVVRAVIVSLVAVFVLALVLRNQARIRRQLRWLIPVAAGATLLIAEFVPEAFSRLHLDELFSAENDGGAVNSRLGVAQLVIDRGPDRLWLGHGAGSLAFESALSSNMIRYAGGGALNAGRGSTNILLTSFWDLGLLGIATVSALIISWIVASLRSSAAHPAIFAMTILFIVDFQANNGFRFAFVWIVIAVASYSAAFRPHDGPAKTVRVLRPLHAVSRDMA